MLHKIIIYPPDTGGYVVQVYEEADGLPVFTTRQYDTRKAVVEVVKQTLKATAKEAT